MGKIKQLILKYQDVLFPVFDVLLNGFNFFMHIYISWYISLNDYSILNASLSFLTILFVFGISIQTYTTKEVGKSKDDPEITGNVMTALILVMLSMTVVLLAASPLLMKFLRTGFGTILLIIMIFDVNIVLSFYRGMIQSHKMFQSLNKSFYIEVLTKLLIIIVLLPFIPGIIIPLVGILAGMLFSLYHAYSIMHQSTNFMFKPSKKLTALFKMFFRVVISNFFLYYLTSISLIVANYYIGEKAAIYAVSLKFSQLILAVAFSVITVLMSYGSELVKDPPAFRKYTNKWLVRFCFGGIAILLGYQLILRHMIVFLFGEAYGGVKAYVVFQGFGYVMLSISYMIITIMILRNRKFQLYLLGVISTILSVGLIFFHQSIQGIIGVEVTSFGLLFVGLLYWFIRKEQNYGDEI